ncbi:F-box protein CPR1-like [Pyrus communis]|uniref:F-box protein CPR1-like n=1 Tax=Pyrus communis TaxID=23211 RepID=UPI0035BF8DA8
MSTSSLGSATNINSPPRPPLEEGKFSSSSSVEEAPSDPRRRFSVLEENPKTTTSYAAFQYPPDVKTTRIILQEEFQYCCDLPEEIVREILLRSSVKSLVKCCAVSKSWRYMIQSSSFIAAHLRHSQNPNADDNDIGRLHLVWSFNDYLLYWDKPASASASSFSINATNTKKIAPLTYQPAYKVGRSKVPPSSYGLVGTSNGLICFATAIPKFPIIIWNPSVRKFVTLPPPCTHKRVVPTYAFGYDLSTNDYKVLTIFRNARDRSSGPAGDTPIEVKVYSLAGGSWKALSPPPPASPAVSLQRWHHNTVFVHGAVHWILRHDQDHNNDVIASFDMATESFSEIELPKSLTRKRLLRGASHFVLSEHGNSLAVVQIPWHYSRSRVNTCYLSLWVMQQYGVVESWTKSSRVVLSEGPVSVPLIFRVAYVGSKGNGEKVFHMSSKNSIRLVTVDFKTKRVKYSGEGEGKYESMHAFVESLVLLDQFNAYSY